MNPLTSPVKLEPSVFYVVSVPIGNVKDFTLRAIEVLKKVDYIVCANRLATKVLLELIDIDPSGRLIHFREGRNDSLVEMLKGGQSMALVVPAGTPCVGDVGNDLVREMLSSGVRVTPVPGVSAPITAVSVSGLGDAEGRFYFGGWLLQAMSARIRQFEVAKSSEHPSVFFDAPERLVQTLSEIAALMPDRRLNVAHEMTKFNESFHSGTAENLLSFYSRGDLEVVRRKGQVSITIQGAKAEAVSIPRALLHRRTYDLIEQGTDERTAIAFVAQHFGVPRSEVASALHAVSNNDSPTEIPLQGTTRDAGNRCDAEATSSSSAFGFDEIDDRTVSRDEGENSSSDGDSATTGDSSTATDLTKKGGRLARKAARKLKLRKTKLKKKLAARVASLAEENQLLERGIATKRDRPE